MLLSCIVIAVSVVEPELHMHQGNNIFRTVGGIAYGQLLQYLLFSSVQYKKWVGPCVYGFGWKVLPNHIQLGQCKWTSLDSHSSVSPIVCSVSPPINGRMEQTVKVLELVFLAGCCIIQIQPCSCAIVGGSIFFCYYQGNFGQVLTYLGPHLSSQKLWQLAYVSSILMELLFSHTPLPRQKRAIQLNACQLYLLITADETRQARERTLINACFI